ncbi:DUF3426 domain-containing protein [Litoribrevibacter euphylliae]|uniref:DUF3426 domain-containing protein n=1 Tax=Litoribrevibacter euphylliae TaxID=1834034 RepID=A0ABV7H6G4_9GAMM
MVAELITQCPKCQTSFKVKEEQLKVANGLVRCGSCLHVFNAVEYSAINSDAPVPPKLQQDEDLSIDDLFEEDTLSKIDQNVDLTDDSVNEFISSSAREKTPQTNSDDDLLDISDEALSADDDYDADELFGGSPIEDEEDNDPDGWAEKLLEELGAESAEENEKLQLAENQESWSPDQTGSLSAHRKDPQPAHFTPSGDHPPVIESEPVYLSTESKVNKTKLYATIGWGIGCFLATLLILFQIAWLNFNTWAKQPEFRSSYTLACAILGCKLPDIKAINKLRASNLIVRSDSENPEHLLIDAIITNQASFTQPYPKLALIFTDNNGTPIASGLILPDQYLGGELSGATIMEKNIPIHVAFKIKDPGANARSYRLEFYP